MKKYILLVLLLATFQAFGQFSNYTNINGRYKWIAGKFDSTFTLPSGTTPSLRTGGGTGSGALFYSTTDSSVYQYTGTQWTRLRGTDTAHVVSAYVRNTTGSIMTPGQVVYINGSTGTTPTIALANNKQDSTSAMTFGFVRGNIAVNGFGYITTFGPLEGVNTNAYTEGEVIYLDSIPGQYTHDKPQAPYHMVTLGYIIKKSGGNGTIYAKIQNGYELEELHNVKITAPVLNKSVIIYDSVNGLWVDTTVSAAGLGLGGSGTTNYLSKWTSSTALGNSLVFDDGTSVGVNTASPSASYKLDVTGAIRSTLDANINGLTVGKGGGSVANNTVVGSGALASNTTGDFNVAIGINALNLNTTTGQNVAVGRASMQNATASLSVAIGTNAMLSAGSGTLNVAVGQDALRSSSASSRTTALGSSSAYNTTGNFNTAVGNEALYTNTSGVNQVAIGMRSLYFATGGNNIGVGYYGGYDITTGTYNTIIGSGAAGNGITTGSYNTIIGSQITGLSSSLANTIILADGQGNQRLRIPSTGNVLIGTSADGGYKLAVLGTANISGGANVALLVDNSGTLAGLRLQNSTYPYLVFNRAGTIARSFGIFNASGDIAIQESQTWSGSNYHIFYGLGGYSTNGSGHFGNNVAANASAILEATSTTKGFLPPRMTGAQAEAIATPATGLMVYANNGNGTTITSTGWWGYDGTTWVKLN